MSETFEDAQRQQVLHSIESEILQSVHSGETEINGVAPIDRGSYYEYRFSTGLKLLEALDIETPLFQLKGTGKTRTFLFRGHQNADWRLEPSLVRPLLGTQYTEQETQRHNALLDAHLLGLQNQYEIEAFCSFAEGANDLGLLLDQDTLELLEINRKRQRMAENIYLEPSTNAHFEQLFPTKEQLRQLALAQHYGFPTRLLDWTFNPYVALFFATEGIFSSSGLQTENEFGIWVLPRLMLDAASIFSAFQIVEVPKFQNANIIAQQGLFTSHIPPARVGGKEFSTMPKHDIENRFASLDEFLTSHIKDEIYQKILTEVSGKPMLFRLSYAEIAPIRRKLQQLNINWRTMMPNIEGAAKEAIRRQRTVGIVD